MDLAQLRYRSIDHEMAAERLREIAGGALGFQPDPYSGIFPTYQRFVYLNALYDISLSFEQSPLIGCTSFLTRDASSGDTLFARVFDFDVDDVFDARKAVFFVRQAGAIPFASVAWPGLVGVVTGMNIEGVAVAAHGGRAGEPRSSGEPVVHALRRVLSSAHDTDEAIAALRAKPPMVSHIVIVADATGKTAALDRVPGKPLHLRWLDSRAVVTNHFLGPSKDDPKNQRVRAETSTLARLQRGEQLMARIQGPATVRDMLALLRDRKAVNDKPLPLGDRTAINALIAAHGVIMNTSRRELWVSESPHLLGRFLRFDLRRILSDGYRPQSVPELQALPADPLLETAELRAWHQSHPQPTPISKP